ncbi:MAG: TIGR01212 family radical SAM protein [Spirochaetaceae bacterium]|nr:TIGR01212 family radical SAM protein [Spirochaetaceae bacterium]
MESRFNRHSERLAERFGQKVWRLGLDAGFGCPHREGGRGPGGCSFCSPEAGLAAYQHNLPQDLPPLEAQIRRAVQFSRMRYGAQAYFLYFQAYSCTNLPTPSLRRIYDSAITILEGFAPGTLKGLVISTRPDCLDEEKAELLSSYALSGLEVWLELGLQSSNPETLKRVSRGHTVGDYAKAVKIAGRAGLRRAVHVILGLPGEGRAEMLETISFVNYHGIEGIKFHDLRLAKGSSLARQFPAGEFMPMHPARLPALLADCLELLDPRVEVMRLCADFSGDSAVNVFPPPDKNRLYEAVERELAGRGSRQGAHADASAAAQSR